jgi:hypothetical protein
MRQVYIRSGCIASGYSQETKRFGNEWHVVAQRRHAEAVSTDILSRVPPDLDPGRRSRKKQFSSCPQPFSMSLSGKASRDFAAIRLRQFECHSILDAFTCPFNLLLHRQQVNWERRAVLN